MRICLMYNRDKPSEDYNTLLDEYKTFHKNSKYFIVEMQKVQYNESAPLVTETLPYIESLGFNCVAPLFSDNGPDGDYCFKNKN